MNRYLVIALILFAISHPHDSARAADPPPSVQMLVPGFEVRELPIDLTNVNNLRYRKQGGLYALGYNGDIWLLTDRDNDGIEDTTSQFFANKGRLRGPIGMAVIPDSHQLLASSVRDGKTIGRGVVVASKGKVSAILDLDGDDNAEEERVIASGWVEIPQNVDAIGVAISPVDGAIYFGLGVKEYNNAYQVDKEGVSHYDVGTDRATVQRIAPDLASRETVCTGVRFSIALEFDQHHELFASDQEGATWLPNGNPFDELLHIEKGKHYGFPPRHPKYLPKVFDEPSLFDYRPQHQSTCGMAFNLPMIPGGPPFGPKDWHGDLLVCGESRGKLYRNRLVRDEKGKYHATGQLIGCLNMLTVDCCLSPRGDLLVACHSGGPDWGTGPSGKGKIFQIRYREPMVPSPIAIWASRPQEIRVEFDKPIDVEMLKSLSEQATIEYGEYVAAGDRFEKIRPGYAVTKLQQSIGRNQLPIYSTAVTSDRKMLLITTAPMEQAVSYALRLPGLQGTVQTPDGLGLSQVPDIDLAFSLAGVDVTWTPATGTSVPWSGSMPTMNIEVAKELVRGTTKVSEWMNKRSVAGTVRLSTQLDGRGLFYPAIQPESKLDYPLEEDAYIVQAGYVIQSNRPFRCRVSGDPTQNARRVGDRFNVVIEDPTKGRELVSVTVEIDMGESDTGEADTVGPAANFSVDWYVQCADGSRKEGALHPDRFLMPWALSKQSEPSKSKQQMIPPEIAGGNWGRGRQIFVAEQAGCAKCHSVHGVGESVGPSLANLIFRDYESVTRDITQPSYALNPDFITYLVRLQDDRILTGTLRSDANKLRVLDQAGKVTVVDMSDVVETKPSAASIMPQGLLDKLDDTQRKDLMTFLLSSAPRMPTEPKYPVKIRSQYEVQSVLQPKAESSSGDPASTLKTIRVLLVAGKKDHGPGEHDYPAWLSMWTQLMSAAHNVIVDSAMDWPSDEQLLRADTIVFYQKGMLDSIRSAMLDRHTAKGGGLVYIHWAVEAGKNAPEFSKRIGLASDSALTKYRHGDIELNFDAAEHPIIAGFSKLAMHDETYWNLVGDLPAPRVLAKATEDGSQRPQFWTLEHGEGRVVVSVPGHYSASFDDPLFRILLLRSIAWSAKQPVDRFADLATLGLELSK
ncbi:MAG: ThuA domain-containing protein [Pirellula sp.]